MKRIKKKIIKKEIAKFNNFYLYSILKDFSIIIDKNYQNILVILKIDYLKVKIYLKI